MFVYVFSNEEADLLKKLGCPFMCKINMGDKIAFVFEDSRLINFEKQNIKAHRTNKLYFE